MKTYLATVKLDGKQDYIQVRAVCKEQVVRFLKKEYQVLIVRLIAY